MLHKIILPAYLPKKQRKLISNKANARKIEVDPIVIEVEGYEHRFPILDYRQKAIPPAQELFNKALNLMQTPADWANLIRILSGYRRADRQFTNANFRTILACAQLSGNMYAVIDALRNVKASRLHLGTVPRADLVLLNLQRMALDADYSEKATRDARTWALMAHELMEDPAHAKKAAGRPLHREPQVVGQVLHLAAAQAALHQGGKDEGGHVRRLAELLTIVWPEGKGLASLHEHDIPADAKPRWRIDFMRNDDAYLALNVTDRIAIGSFILHGITLAKQVVEPELAAKLEPIAQVLRGELGEVLKNRENVVAKRGWPVYDKLIAKA